MDNNIITWTYISLYLRVKIHKRALKVHYKYSSYHLNYFKAYASKFRVIKLKNKKALCFAQGVKFATKKLTSKPISSKVT